MNHTDSSEHALTRYGTAILASMLTTVACMLIDGSTGGSAPLSLFFPAVLASLFYGGIGPGYLAAVLCTISAMVLTAGDRNGLELSDVIRTGIAAGGLFMACALVQVREAKIRASLGALNAAMAATVEGVVRLNPNGRIAEANELFCNLVGASALGLRNRPLLELVVPSFRDPLMKAAKDCWAEGKSDIDVQVLWRGAAPHDVHLALVRTDSVQGRPLGIFCFVKDVAQRKKEIEEIRQSRERMEVAFRHSIVGMTVSDVHGNWLEVNPAFCEMLGYSADELVGRHFSSITHPDDKAGDEESMRKLVSEESEHEVREKRYISRSGAAIRVRMSKEVVHDENGKPEYLVSQVQEISRDADPGEVSI